VLGPVAGVVGGAVSAIEHVLSPEAWAFRVDPVVPVPSSLRVTRVMRLGSPQAGICGWSGPDCGSRSAPHCDRMGQPIAGDTRALSTASNQHWGTAGAVNYGISVSCSRQGYGFSGSNFGGEVVECCG
jgi:hypothetical protein